MSLTQSAPLRTNTVAEWFYRWLDIAAAGTGLLILAPILILLAILVKFNSPGPIFYSAQRVGRNGKLFPLYKFRSMVAGADRVGPAITAVNDRRVTRSGQFLRRTKLDELPQLINVLFGHMSLIGPRPEDPRYVALYTAEQRAILAYRPGITSPASLVFRHEEQFLQGLYWEHTYRTQIMPIKLSIDLTYMSRRNAISDFHVLIATLKAL